MTQAKNTGMSIIGLFQNLPSEARRCVIDVGQRHTLLIGEIRKADTLVPLNSADHERTVTTTFHMRPARENPHA